MLFTFTFIFSQAPVIKADADIILTFKSSEGNNASAVAWNPAKALYYTVIAGNESFPLETFDSNGGFVASREAGKDFRGLWYDPKSKSLKGDAVNEEFGLAEIKLNAQGLPAGEPVFSTSFLDKGDFQNVCSYDAKKKCIIALGNREIRCLDPKTGKLNASIFLDVKSPWEAFNFTTVVYTGHKNYEFAILNIDANRVVYFNREGKATAETWLGDAAVCGQAFRFSFANERMWLYNTENRSWTGYKVF